MKLESLPKEALASGQRVTLLVKRKSMSPIIIHGTTCIQPVEQYDSGEWYLQFRWKRRRHVTITRISRISAIRPGWLTLEEMTR